MSELRSDSDDRLTPVARARPLIRPLGRRECTALLARNHVGRIGFTYGSRIEIQPLHYVFEAGWIYGRTSEGAKLTALSRHQWIAFEVDEVRGAFDWASVLVQGSFHRLDRDPSVAGLAAETHAMHLLRRLDADVLTSADPAPQRTVFFRIATGEITGRIASPS